MRETSRPVCLVTGAARRIGAAIVEGVADTFDVAIHCHSSREEADELGERLREKGCRAEIYPADLGDADAVTGLVGRVHETMGGLDLLVSNASVFEYDSPEEFSAETMRRLVDVNLVAPAVLAREFGRRASGREVFIQLLDNKVFALNPDYFSYSLGKVALGGALDMWAQHFRGRMRVCGIAPGLTMISGNQSEADFQRDWRRTLSGRGPTPDDIVAAVRFIWSTGSLNGETIVLDGGQRLMRLERDVALVADGDADH